MRTPVLTRREVLAAPLSGWAAVLCAACRAQQPPVGGPGEQVVEFMNWSDIQNTTLEVVINNFQARFPRIKVDVQPTPADYENKMRAMLAGGVAPDIMRINDDYVRGYTLKGQLTDLTPYIRKSGFKREDFFETHWDFPIYQGKYWAWQIGNNPRLFFANVDLFNKMGVPLPPNDRWDPPGWTWDDLLVTARRLTDPANDQFGVLIVDDTGYEETFARNNGGIGIYDKDGLKFTLADEAGIQAVQWVVDLTCVHRVQPGPADRSRLGGADAMFRNGKLGMIFRTMGYTNTLWRTAKDLNFDLVPVPKKVHRVTEGSLIVFCIPRIAKNPDGAWELLAYFVQDEAAKLFAENLDWVPARKAPAYQYIKPRPGQPPAHLSLLVEAQANSVNVNYAAGTERARQIYRPILSRDVYTCQKSAREVLSGLRSEIEATLRLEI
jgi:multiple sugar transport system substrate-binding protein